MAATQFWHFGLCCRNHQFHIAYVCMFPGKNILSSKDRPLPIDFAPSIVFFLFWQYLYKNTDENVGHSSFLKGGSGHLVIVIMAVFWSHDQDHGGVENSAHLRAGVWFAIPWWWDLVLGLKSRPLSCGLEAWFTWDLGMRLKTLSCVLRLGLEKSV